MQNAECRIMDEDPEWLVIRLHSFCIHHSVFSIHLLLPFPLSLWRAMSFLIRWRANATFCAPLIFEKSGDPSLFFGSPPSTTGAGITAVATAGAWPLRGNED